MRNFQRTTTFSLGALKRTKAIKTAIVSKINRDLIFTKEITEATREANKKEF